MVTDTQIQSPDAPAIPDTLPALPLIGGAFVFPHMVQPLVIGQQRSIRLIDDVMKQEERLVVLVASREEDVERPEPENLHLIGTVARIHHLSRGPNGVLHIVVQGLERVQILDYPETEPYLVARVEEKSDHVAPGIETEALRRVVIDMLRRLQEMSAIQKELVQAAEGLSDPRHLVYLVASQIQLSTSVRQEILELDPVDAKLRLIIEHLQHEVEVTELGVRINTETQGRLSRTQREYYLREQLRSIQEELGEGSESDDIAELRRQIEEADLPEDVRREADRELKRLEIVPPASPEHGIIRTYLDWLATLPWNTQTGGPIDIAYAQQVLDEDHYDLEKIKDRILEYLAVRKLRDERLADQASREDGSGSADVQRPVSARREPILCFLGPPGVGKTSLGQSIARALGRKFVRISLGGIRDEAEIRGHRRTYIGALPGRIIQAIKQAGARDPVFMLDEIDKVGADWRGDPSSALLEVLDPAQNDNFVDNYLGVQFDLSQVLFIATGNTIDTIPDPLLDRMEVLQLAGYTEHDKVQIAEKYLIPKQLEAHALNPEELSFEREAVRQIVRGYTREAGVRNLEREIATICRKVARRFAENQRDPVHITAEDVAPYLGRPRYFDEVAERIDRPGIATGLAWTPAGGDVLFVEATMMPRRNERLILTGMLGNVMSESAQAALSYVHANAQRIGFSPSVLDTATVHLHVPAGAIPKDGPSAGVTMATAIASLTSNRIVDHRVAMTGEITLRGKVIPVGGIREKVLSAHRSGIETVILPKRNEQDLDDVPDDLRNELEFVLVTNVDEVLDRALQSPAESAREGREGKRERR